jgi:hypothetical protein
MTADAAKANSDLVSKFLGGKRFEQDLTYTAKTDAQRHEVAKDIPLRDVIDMLVEYRLEDPRDTESFTAILASLGEALDIDPEVKAAVYRMRPKATGVRRTVSSGGTLDDGFQQGPTALADGGTTYPGDAFFKADDRLSIQLHQYDLARKDGSVGERAAPLLAIYVPPALAKNWLIQTQRGQGGA